MVNIEAGVAEAATETLATRVMTLVRYAFVEPMRPRLGARMGTHKTFRQGSTSRSAVPPDHITIGGKAVA